MRPSKIRRIKIGKIKKRETRLEDFNIPTENVDIIASSLKKKFDLEEKERKYATVKEVLTFLAGGLFLAASIIMPGLSLGLKAFIDNEKSRDVKEWRKFNPSYLAKTLRRLEKQKLVEISEEGKYKVVKITDRGRKRVLRYALEELEIKKPKIWDGRWYFVTYDIPRGKNWLRDIIRNTLISLGFYKFQESLYIHAYPCEHEIEFLREYLGAGEYIKILVVDKIENDKVFREYFGV